MRKIKKNYSNGEITVVWQPHLCVHAGICFSELPKVFDPSARPWIKLEEGETRDIIDIVDSCPTDALTYYENKYLKKENTMENETRDTVKIKALTDGPLLVEGILEITDGNGNKIDTQGRTALCRCGHSKTKPFCDGSHKTIGFKE